ncbi:helix-turn-helix domain-containing protein [Methylocystis sp. JAN1]|uniref:helix-turn-helix domain-containing protein n=1 Tax=Methylocystis sp. JAN1 TaxID=3397211 RepID=UPI003FA22D4D
MSISCFEPRPFPIIGLSVAAAAAVARIPAAALASPARRRAPVARARQLAVYLHHVALGASLSACARAFARDRATVRHACAAIEDLRDDPHVDRWAARLELALAAQRDMVCDLLREAEGAAR